jgi:hypothetical protein
MKRLQRRATDSALHPFLYPTESFYALGVKATNRLAVEQLFRIKQREPGKPIALIAANLQQVRKFFIMSKTEERLARQFWPGSLTMLLKPKRTIQSIALGAKKIGVRVPAHVTRRIREPPCYHRPARILLVDGRRRNRRKLKHDFPDTDYARSVWSSNKAIDHHQCSGQYYHYHS